MKAFTAVRSSWKVTLALCRPELGFSLVAEQSVPIEHAIEKIDIAMR
jgi:hypothetical protein